MSSYTNAENIKSRVDSFLKSNQEREAFQLIYSYLILKRKNWQWTQALEKLMIYYIDLCLTLDEDESLQIGLKNFKDCVQHHHRDSLKIILEKYVTTTEEQFEKSCEAMENVAEFFEEMHQETNANDFYLNSLNLEKGQAKEKVKKTWVTLIEAYKRAMNLVYKNKNLLEMYSGFALRGLKRCSELKAIEDFKGICRVLRLNLKFVNRAKNEKKTNYKCSDHDASDILIKLRHEVFDIAWKLGLMQESFNILEELNELMRSRSRVSLDLLVQYYGKLNEVFYKGEFVLFHAIALMEYFSCLVRNNEPESRLVAIADRVILAVLSVGRNSEEFTLSASLKNKYCVMFSSRQHMPSLTELINGLATSRILTICSSSSRELYRLYTGKYGLFEFSDVLQTELAKVSENFSHYVEGIKANCVSIILKLVSDFFENIPFEDLKEFTSFVDFEKVKQEILLLEYTQELDLFLNFEEQLVEFRGSDIGKDEWLVEHEKLLHQIEETIALADSLRSDESSTLHISQLENAYVHSFAEMANTLEDENLKMKRQNEGRVYLFKVKIKEVVIDLEEQKRLEIEKKIMEGKKKINIKILNMKRKKIQEILKINPKMKLLDIPLKKLKKNDLMQLDFDVFDAIHDKLEEQAKIKANEELKTKYKNFDYMVRYFIKDNWETKQKKQEAEIDLEEIAQQRKDNLEKAEKLREELKQGNSFIGVFKKKLMVKRQKELEEQYHEFKTKLNEEYKLKIYEKSKEELAKKKRKEEEEAKKNNRGGFSRNQMGNRTQTYASGVEKPKITSLQRGINFRPGESLQNKPMALARRGENFTPGSSRFTNSRTNPTPSGPMRMAKRGEGLSRNTGFTSRPMGGQMSRPMGSQMSRPMGSQMSRPMGGQMSRPMGGQMSRPTGGQMTLSKRGTGLQTNTSSQRGNNPRTMMSRGSALTRPQTTLSRGFGNKKPEETKKAPTRTLTRRK